MSDGEHRLKPGERLRVNVSPLFEQRPDGTWEAWYAVYDWRVTARTEDEARQLAAAKAHECDRADPEARAGRTVELAYRALDGEVIPGIEASIMSEQEYEQHMAAMFALMNNAEVEQSQAPGTSEANARAAGDSGSSR